MTPMTMNRPAILSGFVKDEIVKDGAASPPRRYLRGSAPVSLRAPLFVPEESEPQHQAELFYLQKQIQSQTPMVIVMEDGETIEGCIEWYDRNALKVRGRSRMLIYKAAIKYMYKQGENG
jgi:sRNA-binding regulator protein Hfq